MAGKATEAEPARRPHPVITYDVEIGAELGGGSDDRLGDLAFSVDRLRLDPESAGSERCRPKEILCVHRVVADMDQDHLRTEVVGDLSRDRFGHFRGRCAVCPYDDLPVGGQNGFRTIK
jgi:hypothetical protein